LALERRLSPGTSELEEVCRVGALTLSTRITLVRVALIPVVVALLVGAGDREELLVPAAIVFGVAAATDWLDGWLARRWQQVTDLGNFLDTTADKLLVIGALLGLMALDRANVWVVFVVVAREVAVLGLRAAAATAAVVVSASIWGKLKFGVQVLGVIVAIVHPPVEIGPLLLDQWLLIVVAVVTALSAVDYFARFGELLGLGREVPK
jgi:CDP-diacylglycerol--glycerol-3-phosphate 3-phosphatidyltransferase